MSITLTPHLLRQLSINRSLWQFRLKEELFSLCPALSVVMVGGGGGGGMTQIRRQVKRVGLVHYSMDEVARKLAKVVFIWSLRFFSISAINHTVHDSA